ncbi:hypothetical protein ABW20_dc0105145 [Dactylellina cionopaga]|nr:hypothetical protein ABW20_dc0105145 [Dactylellina cionopaga]
MAILDSLPVEIFREILLDECLRVADRVAIKRVCKYFYDVVERFCPVISEGSYVLHVDDNEHRTWKFARSLLVDPDIGKQFADISVEWHRRALNDAPEKWTKLWEWTKEEKAQIRKITKEMKFTFDTTKTILDGVNSEALLPLIFCFTPNLKALNLGDIDPSLFYSTDVDLGRNWGVEEVVERFDGLRSTVKRLEIVSTRMTSLDYEAIVCITGSLEYLWLDLYNPCGNIVCNWLNVGAEFLGENKNLLRKNFFMSGFSDWPEAGDEEDEKSNSEKVDSDYISRRVG